MENNEKKKGKEKQEEAHETPPQQPSSSSSAEPDAKRLKLTDPPVIRPPPPNSGPVGSFLQASAAQLRIMKPKERAEYKLALVLGQPMPNNKSSKRRRRAGRVWIRPGASPLGPGPSPYERVREVVSLLKNFFKLEDSSPPQPVAVVGGSSSSMGKPTLEKVIVMLDEYVEGISTRASEEEMEGLLREFQRNVDVDVEEISWYGLIKESDEAFLKSLTEHFICETFFESDLEEEDDDDAVPVNESDHTDIC